MLRAQIELNKRICACSDARAVLAAVEAAWRHGPVLSGVNVSTALHRVAKLAKGADKRALQEDARMQRFVWSFVYAFLFVFNLWVSTFFVYHAIT